MASQARLLFVFQLLLLGLSLSPHESAADAVAGPMVIVTDTTSDFRAIGALTSTDTNVPPNGIVGPILAIPGVNWTFRIDHDVADWRFGLPPPVADNGADDATISIGGEHIDGPHPADTDPNPLDRETSPAQDITFGGVATLFKADVQDHPTAGGGRHFDHYAVKQKATPLQGPPHMLTGPTVVVAKHSTRGTESLPYGLTMGSSRAAGSTVSYDAVTRQLHFALGPLDILNSAGRIQPGIESAYQNDAVRQTHLQAGPLQFLGMDEPGVYRFGPGQVQMVDPSEQLTCSGSFSEYMIRGTTNPTSLQSYALFDKVLVADRGTPCPSAFLDDFTDVNFLGEGLTAEVWQSIEGVDLAFVTATDLRTLTNGFTASAFNVPADIVVCANSSPGHQAGADPHEPGLGTGAATMSYPNPFSEGTMIRYSLTSPGPAEVSIFNPAGQLVRRLATLPVQAAGEHTILWDGRSQSGERVPAGVYFYRFSSAGRTESRRIVLIE